MARLPRLKVENQTAWYHLCARVAGGLRWFPFEDPVARHRLFSLIRHYVRVYFCDLATFTIMGNHYHMVARFQAYRRLTRHELTERARLLYKNPDKVLIDDQQWQRFNQRLFDVSEFMRNIQMAYAKWYNRHYRRRGSFWGERFKSTILSDLDSVLNCMLYVDLNPVRAGLVQRPEDWLYSSAVLRSLSRDSWLLPLSEILPGTNPAGIRLEYRARLYYRGALTAKNNTLTIPEDILKEEENRGFSVPGQYRKRLRYFTDGLVLGTQERVQEWIDLMRRRGRYLRRKHPILHLGSAHTLREQRRSSLEPLVQSR